MLLVAIAAIAGSEECPLPRGGAGPLVPGAHRARGLVRVWQTGSCGFSVSHLELSAARPDLQWILSRGLSNDDLRSATACSSGSLNGISGTVMGLNLTVPCIASGVEDAVVLVLWDPLLQAVVAHVQLRGPRAFASEPTHFDNCRQLSPTLRLRWSLTWMDDGFGSTEDTVSFGLEGLVPPDSYMAFGPSNPAASKSLMVGSDVAVVSMARDTPSAVDAFISSYDVCRYDDTSSSGVSGVCPDSVWERGWQYQQALLRHAERGDDGITFIRFERVRHAASSYDLAIEPDRAQAFVWAVGPLMPRSPGTPVNDPSRPDTSWGYHSRGSGASFGQLTLRLEEPHYSCTAFPSEDERNVRHAFERAASGDAGGIGSGGGGSGALSAGWLLRTHGLLLTVAWALCAPAAAWLARFAQTSAPSTWLSSHMGLAVCVAVGSVCGLALSFTAAGGVDLRSWHARFGFSTVALLALQVAWAVARPPKTYTASRPPAAEPTTSADSAPLLAELSPWRRLWATTHRLCGYGLLTLGFASLCTGARALPARGEGVGLARAWEAAVLGWGAVVSIAWWVRAAWRSGPLHVKSSSTPMDAVGAVVYALLVAAAIAAGLLSSPLLSPCLTSPSVCLPNGEVGSAHAALANTPRPPTMPPSPSEPPRPPLPDGCSAFPTNFVGDGWCDAHSPFNTLECGYDGGDCCDASAAIMDCRDPSSSHFGRSMARADYPVPANPRYGGASDAAIGGRSTSDAPFVRRYNNYWEFSIEAKSGAVEQLRRTPQLAELFRPESWELRVEGLVRRPLNMSVDALLRTIHLEERTCAYSNISTHQRASGERDGRGLS